MSAFDSEFYLHCRWCYYIQYPLHPCFKQGSRKRETERVSNILLAKRKSCRFLYFTESEDMEKMKVSWWDKHCTHFCTQGGIQQQQHWYHSGSEGRAGWRYCSARLEQLYLKYITQEKFTFISLLKEVPFAILNIYGCFLGWFVKWLQFISMAKT